MSSGLRHPAARLAVLIVLLALGGCVAGQESGPVTLVFKYARILGDADPLPALLREFEAAHANRKGAIAALESALAAKREKER